MRTKMSFNPTCSRMIHAVVAAVSVLVVSAPAIGQVAQEGMKRKPRAPEAQTVKFTSEDGVHIEADYYAPTVPGNERVPVAILIHMYPADRTSWRPLVPGLLKAGFAVLAYDIRGTGGSMEPAEKKLKQCYIAKDPEHFNDAWKDTRAAKEWLSGQPRCDVSRIALIGASIGSSISLHYASQDKAVKAVVCLSPGLDYLGVDSVDHIKKCSDRAILLISPKSEYKHVKKLLKAAGGAAKGKKFSGTNKQHGTNLLKSDDAKKVKRQITVFLKRAMPAEQVGEEEEMPVKSKKRPRARRA